MLKIITEKSMFNSKVKEDYSNPPWYKGRVEILTTKGPVIADYEVRAENNCIYELHVTINNETIALFNQNDWITKPTNTYDNIMAQIYMQYGAPIFMK